MSFARLFFLFIFALNLQLSLGAECDDAPDETMKKLCLQIAKSDALARDSFVERKKFEAMYQPVMGEDPLECISAKCKCLCDQITGTTFDSGSGVCFLPPIYSCPNLRDGEVYCRMEKTVRKEYRTLTDEERNRFHAALKELKNTKQDGFDKFAGHHLTGAQNGPAHGGPAFLGWHREYLKRFEFKLRHIDPTLSVPYWDSTLDEALPKPEHSILFTKDFLGESDAQEGFIKNGPFSDWAPFDPSHGSRITRNLGMDGRLFDEDLINQILSNTSLHSMFSFSRANGSCAYPRQYNSMEYIHGLVHAWVGGLMGNPETASSDPLFFMHHAFIDNLWEMWRMRNQPSAEQRRIFNFDSNQDCHGPQHWPEERMLPFDNRNKDGLSDNYTTQLYSYAERPTCANNCGNSRYLYCDRRFNRCVSKVKPNGECDDHEQCLNGRCEFSRDPPTCFAATDESSEEPKRDLAEESNKELHEDSSTNAFFEPETPTCYNNCGNSRNLYCDRTVDDCRQKLSPNSHCNAHEQCFSDYCEFSWNPPVCVDSTDGSGELTEKPATGQYDGYGTTRPNSYLDRPTCENNCGYSS